MDPNAFFRTLQKQIPQLKREITKQIIQVEAENFHADNFRREGFTDRAFHKWTARKNKDKNPKRRSLLVKTSALKRAATRGSANQSLGRVRFKFPATYMKVHNEGLRAGRGKGFKMRQRQFVGKSWKLQQAVQRKANILIQRKLNNL